MTTSRDPSPGAIPQPNARAPSSPLQVWRAEMQRAALQTQRFFQVLSDAEAQVGLTPNDVVWKRGSAQLFRYRVTTAEQFPVPLLMVHSLVNKPYILDLTPGNSFVEFLVKAGFDVYLIDWGTPRPEDKRLSLDSYVLDLLPAVVEVMREESEASEFSLFGYCMGGQLALMYAATHTAEPLRNLVTLATPVDSRGMGLNSFLAQERFMDVDRLVDTFGNIPTEIIEQSFRVLRPASTEFSPGRYISLWENVLNDRYVQQYRAFDRWARDQIPFPGEAFRQMVKEIVQRNRLFEGTMTLHGRPAPLSAITCSFLAVAAEQDHIVPLAATTCQPELVGSTDKELLVMPGGHVGLAAGRKAASSLWPKVASWLAERSRSAAAPASKQGSGRLAAARRRDVRGRFV